MPDGVAPIHFRVKFDRGHEDADLAAEFVEQEVGHFDWMANWPKFKERYPTREALLNRVREWLDYMQIEHDPVLVVNHIDAMMGNQQGKWR